MLKVFVILFCLIIYFNETFAKISPIVRCLAQEEQKYHDSKQTGPIYKLNQELINLLAIENKLKFSANVTNKVCESSKQALTLLSHLLLDRSDIFVLPQKGQNDWQIKKFAEQVDQIISKNYDVFLNLLSYVQIEINSPHCLQKIVPGYQEYLEREKYLKDIRSQYNEPKSLFVMKKVLDEIHDLPKLKKKCSSL